MTLPPSVCATLVADDVDAVSRLKIDRTFITTANEEGQFPIHLMALNDSVQGLDFLLTHPDLDVNMYNRHGRTALHLSSFHGHVATVERLLLKETIQVDQKTKGNGCTALYLASCGGHTTVIHVLLRAGADPNLPTQSNSTPLIGAAFSGSLLSVEALVDAGANPNVKNDNGVTAMHTAASKGYVHILDYLLSHQGDGSIHDEDGRTPTDILESRRESYLTSTISVHTTADEDHQCGKTCEPQAFHNETNDSILWANWRTAKPRNPQPTTLLNKQLTRSGRRQHEKVSPNERARDSSTQSGSRSAGDLSDKSHPTSITEILA